jgi:hypothetical protein
VSNFLQFLARRLPSNHGAWYATAVLAPRVPLKDRVVGIACVVARGIIHVSLGALRVAIYGVLGAYLRDTRGAYLYILTTGRRTGLRIHFSGNVENLKD